MALLWWIFTDGQADSWLIGIPAVLLATFVSLRLVPPGPHRLRLLGTLKFAGFFVGQSLRAGLDVARRVLCPRPALEPDLVSCTLSLPEGLPRLLLANTLNLLPGTLIVHFAGDDVVIHVLDQSQDTAFDVRRAEAYVAGAFGLTEGDAGWS